MMSSPLNGPVCPRNVFCAEVVLIRVELELEHVVGPAGERAGGLANVALGVVADAHREQLEQLAAEVLVRDAS